MNVKQVIVMRYKFPNHKGELAKIRLGKYIAQASHASMAFLSHKVMESYESQRMPSLSEEERYWLDNSFKKICCKVDTEEELLDIYEKAKEAGLTVHLITDSGLTEFHGQPTHTCLCIGPHDGQKIDPITSHLELL